MSIFYAVQIMLLCLVCSATLYIFLFSFAGLFYKQRKYEMPSVFNKIAVLIPGYQEDEVILEVAASALAVDYPKDKFDVVVIADSFQKNTLTELAALPLKVINVEFEKSTKAKALNSAMSELTGLYDIAVILDADNIMATDFLIKINAAYSQGFTAIQGHRTAKNLDNSWAILDAVSEEVNNNIFRKGHRVLGLSSAIIGSGMAFNYNYFKSIMATATAVGGFDKEIELKILKEGHKIAYLDDALVLDEKVQKADVFGNQRRRWLSAQFHYFRKDFFSALQDLVLKGNFDYFDKAIQFIQPPRILLLGAVTLLGAFFITANWILHGSGTLSAFWIVTAVACILSFLFSIPRSFYNAATCRALLSLPKGMIVMLISLMKIRGANKKFIHTKHTANIR